MPERECPRCREPMLSGKLGPIELDSCRYCAGVWFDRGELGQVSTAGPAVIRRLCREPAAAPAALANAALGPPSCPLCHAPLQSMEYASMPGVRLETCYFCEGHWVSQSSLGRLVAGLEGRTEWDQVATARLEPAAPGAPAPGVPAAPAAKPPTPAAPAASGVFPGAAAPAAAPATGDARKTLCPKCGEENAGLAAACWACGQQLLSPVVGACPRCEAGMRSTASGEVTLNGCDGCGGIWITPNRLRAILLQPLPNRAKLFQYVGQFRTERIRRIHPELTCPYCTHKMEGAPLPRMTKQPVFHCSQCSSLFLDYCVLEELFQRHQ